MHGDALTISKHQVQSFPCLDFVTKFHLQMCKPLANQNVGRINEVIVRRLSGLKKAANLDPTLMV